MMTDAFYKAIKTPILIVSPTEDEFVSIKAKEHAASHLVNAEMVSIPEARHGIWYDRSNTIQARLWNVIDRFVQRHENRPEGRRPAPPQNDKGNHKKELAL